MLCMGITGRINACKWHIQWISTALTSGGLKGSVDYCLLCLLCRSWRDPAAQRVWLFRGRGFSTSSLLQFSYVFKAKRLHEVVLLENGGSRATSLATPVCSSDSFCHLIRVCPCELSAHLHARATKTYRKV